MKLFGKKDKNAAAPEIAADDLGDVDTGFEEMEGASAPSQPLSAPSRSIGASAGGSRKNLMVLGLLAVVLAICGGYFWYMGENDSQPIHVTAQTSSAIVPDAQPPQVADATAVAPPAPDALVTTMTVTVSDPLAAPAPVAPGAPVDPFAAPAADPAAPNATSTTTTTTTTSTSDPLAGDPAAPPAPDATTTTTTITTTTDPLAAATVPADPAVAAAVLGVPPSSDEAAAIAAIPAVGTPVSDMPDEMAPDMAVAATLATPDGMPPQPGVAPADVAVTPAPGETAPTWAVPGTAAVPGTSNPAATASSPNEAELAIVQHADVIDQLSRPADGQTTVTTTAGPEGAGAPFDPNATKTFNRNAMKTVGEILEQPGIVRELPSGYMTIRKESNAGSIDSRLTSARSALAQGNNSAALELFDELHKDYPKDKRILMGRAISLHKLGQKDEALAAYEAVLNRDPKNLDALNNMLGLLKEKDPQLAVEKLQELQAAYPYSGDITAQLGVAYASTGQYDQALRFLNLADGLKPGSAFVLYNKSVLLDKMGRTREAAPLYRLILRMAAEGDIDQSLPLESIRRRLAALQ